MDVPVGVSVPFAAVLVLAVTELAVGVCVIGSGGSGITKGVEFAVVEVPVGFAIPLAKGLPFEGTHLHRYSPSPVAVHLQSRFAGNCA